jgi:hypothetical protein
VQCPQDNQGIGKSKMGNEKSERKLLENPLISSMVVPVAIVLVGALIIFGVTKILSTERSYKDLVSEMHSKTFGNRWIAAYELSKLISSSQIPKEDVPWLIDNLSQIYVSAQDPRTRQFTVVAMGAMRNKSSLPYLLTSLSDVDAKVRFHAVVALGNLPGPLETVDWSVLKKLAMGEDHGLAQAAILTLVTHRVADAEPLLEGLLGSSNERVSYTTALGLINYRNKKALPLLREVLSMEFREGWDNAQIMGLKGSLLSALKRNNWKALNRELEIIAATKTNLTLSAKVREVLNELKK